MKPKKKGKRGPSIKNNKVTTKEAASTFPFTRLDPEVQVILSFKTSKKKNNITD
jgi:hypothetical protein